ncbi:hypothetical protein L0Y65_05650 [Candidatus Micrarchaeota archaeon]|nr:hypothetical protein [Candidatus Micrarchaeota archaeon]
MNGGPKTKPGPERQKVVSILKAKRLPYSHRPAIEPPCEVKSLAAPIPEQDRFLIAEADIHADIRLGDLNQTALRKCRYILENAPEAFKDRHFFELMLARTIRIISEYGEPEGVPLIGWAVERYSGVRSVREEASKAIAQIGDESSLALLLRLLALDASSPEVHLRSITALTERYPEAAGNAIEGIRAVAAGCAASEGAIEEIRRAGRGKI